MLISYTSVYLLFFVLLLKDAVSKKKDWSYYGRRFNRPVNSNGHLASQRILRRQGDVQGVADEALGTGKTDKDKDGTGDESEGSLYIPGKKGYKVDDKSKKGDDKGKEGTGDESEGSLYVPGKKGKKGDNKGKKEDKGVTKDDNKIDTDDPDHGVTSVPDVQREAGYQKYHDEKISYTMDNMATSWPLGIIPYYFDMSSYDHILASRVREVMDFLEGASCVQFKPLIVKPEEKHNWIHITNPTLQRECVHRGMHLGDGEIRMTLGLDCLKRRDILHTLLHAMGFMDEVSHPSRDQYIRVMWDNIQPMMTYGTETSLVAWYLVTGSLTRILHALIYEYQNLYSIAGGSNAVEYDPMSVMHFHDRAFSKNGHATVVPLMPGLQIQPSDKLSQLDKMKLRLAFGHECNRRAVDHLLDTCKTVLHGEANSPDKREILKNYVNPGDDSSSDYRTDPKTDSSDETDETTPTETTTTSTTTTYRELILGSEEPVYGYPEIELPIYQA